MTNPLRPSLSWVDALLALSETKQLLDAEKEKVNQLEKENAHLKDDGPDWYYKTCVEKLKEKVAQYEKWDDLQVKEIMELKEKVGKLEAVLQMFVDHYEKLPDDTLVGTGLTNEPFFAAKEVMKNNRGIKND